MNTEKLGVRRILVVAVFSLTCFGLMLFLWNAFGGSVPLKPRGYRVVVALPEADLLAQEADVRISGVSVGRVV
ncbi:MAG TPA: MlaD family protein, partial [Baekduia sp.]|nr:MlaD family protein [Baekduia sp.]